MFKKVLLLAVVLCLVGQVALAAGEDTNVITPRQPFRYVMKTFFEGVRERFTLNHERRAALFLEHAEERVKELEALAEEDPEALKEKLLARHDALVAKAQEIVTNKENLPDTIVSRMVETQLKVMEMAQERFAEAEDQELAQKRLALLQAKQELVLATVEKNAEKMAEHLIGRAEQMLSNATDVRARIEAGEGIEVVKERQKGIIHQVRERRQKWLDRKPGK